MINSKTRAHTHKTIVFLLTHLAIRIHSYVLATTGVRNGAKSGLALDPVEIEHFINISSPLPCIYIYIVKTHYNLNEQ